MSNHTLGRRNLLLGAAMLAVTGCSQSKIRRRYTGPLADGVVVRKSERAMYILRGTEVLSAHRIDLGFAPGGHKEQYGDGRTPEGQYMIDRRNYNSSYYLSLGISYPNAEDIARAAEAGIDPGGDIFIHGGPRGWFDFGKKDWTAGCIAVTDREMEMIYQMVPNGTPIWIEP